MSLHRQKLPCPRSQWLILCKQSGRPGWAGDTAPPQLPETHEEQLCSNYPPGQRWTFQGSEMQSNTLLSTARTSRQQTSTSTGPLSDRELRVWDLLRSGHELGHGEPPDSWAKNKAVLLRLCPLLDSTYFANLLYTSINQYSYLFWSPLDAKSRPGCRTQQRCRGWAPSGWCPPHPAKPAWCCRRTNSPLHPALLSAGPPTDGISDNPSHRR